ncbi:ATP-dependent Clp protease proteolytic subunit-like isoform X1 [Phoenix dactylifera]|uniref:ATP-dependent Clp protease proteolytic subunit n=1 Tax=Phoenix dactylifera TaxID=42345 RepID=A0A8B9AWQ8_PHODC|nr:ATP-dependent Clp protease proteolytic subunit-like isoform X1 [Phoenix dactylifera]
MVMANPNPNLRAFSLRIPTSIPGSGSIPWAYRRFQPPSLRPGSLPPSLFPGLFPRWNSSACGSNGVDVHLHAIGLRGRPPRLPLPLRHPLPETCSDSLPPPRSTTEIKPRVGTVCFGVAASQGAVLLAGGEKGMRHAMPNAHIMIHQPQSGCGGHVEDVRQQVKEAVQSRHALEFGLIDGVLVRNQSFPSDSFVDLAFRTWTSTYYNLQILMLGLSPFISSGGLLSSENQSLHSASSSSLQFNDLMHNCPRIYDC